MQDRATTEGAVGGSGAAVGEEVMAASGAPGAYCSRERGEEKQGTQQREAEGQTGDGADGEGK